MRSVLLALSVAVSAIVPTAQADETSNAPLIFVELFTSQGCSSCPPADAVLGELAERDDIAAVTLNVDYWDYLGWPDRLAKSEYTARQRAYQTSLGGWTIYTPQLVVQGRSGVVGSDRRRVETALKENAGPAQVEVTLSRIGDENVVDVAPAALGGELAAASATVWAFVYKDQITQPIGAGENDGRTITYHNVAREMTVLGEWTPTSERRFALKTPTDRDGVIVIVQEDRVSDVGPVIGVGKLTLSGDG
ncbi:MAG: DUF1223 domain-containing protein [Pseudomonadota bacterium]